MLNIAGGDTQLQEPATANSPASTVQAETMTAKTTDAQQETTTEQDTENKTPIRVKIRTTQAQS
jgi:hypothetical protein